ALDIAQRLEQVVAGVSPRLLLGRALSLAHVVLAADDVGDARARVVLHRQRFALALLELPLLSLEPLDQRRHVALALRDALLRARDDVGRQVEPSGDAD